MLQEPRLRISVLLRLGLLTVGAAVIALQAAGSGIPALAVLAGVFSLLGVGLFIWTIVSYEREKAAYDAAVQRHVQEADEDWQRRIRRG